MAEVIKNKKDMRVQSMEGIRHIERILNDANSALNDKNRTIATSDLPTWAIGAGGAAVGGAISLAAIAGAGSVAGLSAAGITSGLAALGGGALAAGGAGILGGLAVAAAPVAVLAVGGAVITEKIKFEKLIEAKELCYKEAISKQNAIATELRRENASLKSGSRKDKERIEYLTQLNILLQGTINDLKHDLGK